MAEAHVFGRARVDDIIAQIFRAWADIFTQYADEVLSNDSATRNYDWQSMPVQLMVEGKTVKCIMALEDILINPKNVNHILSILNLSLFIDEPFSQSNGDFLLARSVDQENIIFYFDDDLIN